MPSTAFAQDTKELSRWLARLQGYGVIGPQDASDLRTKYLAQPLELPVQLDSSHANVSEAALMVAAGEVMSLRFGTRRKPDIDYRLALAELNLRMLEDLSEKAQDEFKRKTKVLVAGLATAGLNAFALGFLGALLYHLFGQGLLGGRGHLADANRVQGVAARELGYLQRFVDSVALKDLQGRPYSEKYLVKRAEMYSGPGRAEFSRANEESLERRFSTPAGMKSASEPGMVIFYKAIDDGETCNPCHESQGWYLPGAGPHPGDVCLGGPRCRCKRLVRWNPEIYRKLINGEAVNG